MSLSSLSSARHGSLLCVVSMLKLSLYSHHRRLPQPTAQAGKAPSPVPGLLAKVSLSLIGYDWVICPLLNQSLWPGKHDVFADYLAPQLHTPTLSQKCRVNSTREVHAMRVRSQMVCQSKIMILFREEKIC